MNSTLLIFCLWFSSLLLVDSCNSNGNCPANRNTCTSSSSCDPGMVCLNSKCSYCQSQSDCSNNLSSKPYCDTDNLCKQCTSNSHCTSATASRCYNKVCSPCSVDSDCSLISGNRKKCSSGTCVECTIGTDCSTGTCDSTKQCQGDFCTPGSCTDPTLPICLSSYCRSCSASATACSGSDRCSPNGSCQPCFQNDHCTDVNSAQCVLQTLPTRNYCGACTSDTHCAHFATQNKCLNSQKCVECITASDCTPGDSCVSNVCTPPTVPLKIVLSATDAPDTYLIDFPTELVTNTDTPKGIFISLIDIDVSTYTYSLTKVSNTQYKIRFTGTQTIPSTQLLLTYSCTPYGSLASYIPSQFEAQIATKRMPYFPEEQREISEAMQSAGTAATIAMTAVSGSMLALGGNPALLWALINLIQTFYYLIFVNVNYPANVQFFLQIFTLAGFDFIPNPITWISSDIEDLSLPTPERFEEYEVNGLFLNNAGNMLMIWLVVLVLYGFAAVGNRYLNRLSKLATTFFYKMVSWFEWSGVLRALITSYAELTQAAFLQLRVLTYDSGIYSSSSIIGIVFAVYAIVFPFFMGLLTRKFITPKNRKLKKFGALIEEFSDKGTYSKYFTTIFLFKRLGIIATLVYLHDHPYIEILLLTSMSLATIILFFKFKPYETRFANWINIASEMLFLIVHLLIFVLIHDDNITVLSEDDRLNVGWILIGICGIIVLLNFTMTINEQINMIKETWQLLKKILKKNNRKKVYARKRPPQPVIQDDSSQNPLEWSRSMRDNSSFSNISNTMILETSPAARKSPFERRNKVNRSRSVHNNHIESPSGKHRSRKIGQNR